MVLRPLLALAAIAAIAGNSHAQKPVGEPAKQVKQDDSKKPALKAEPTKPAATDAPEEKPGGLGGLIAGAGGLFCFACYCLMVLLFELIPTWIALARKHPNTVPIFLVNFFLGWTCIGWFVALVWSFTNPQAGATVIIEDRPRRRRQRRRDDDYDDD